MIFRQILQKLPVVVLVVTICYSLYVVSTSDIILLRQHVLGIALVQVALLTNFFNTKFYNWLLGVILLLGTFNIVAFTPIISFYTITFGVNILAFKIDVQLFSFVLLILFFGSNHNYFSNKRIMKKNHYKAKEQQ